MSDVEDVDVRVPDKVFSSGITLRWEAITSTLAVLSLASLVVIVVIVSTNGTDLLSVVALMLAVISLAAQLIVTWVQSSSARQHHLELSKLSHEADVSLKSINARVDSLIETQTGHFSKLLEYVINQSIDPEMLRRVIGEARLQELLPSGDSASKGERAGGAEAAEEAEARMQELLDQVTRGIKDELNREARAALSEATSKVTADMSVRSRQTSEDELIAAGLERVLSMPKESAAKFVDWATSEQSPYRFDEADRQSEWISDARDAGLIRSRRDIDPSTDLVVTEWRLSPLGIGARRALRFKSARNSPRTRMLVARLNHLNHFDNEKDSDGVERV